jgi:glycerol-3-phosphate dehydrogenase (NAD(P)+)
MSKVAILGAGRWGTALGLVLSRKGNEVMLFDRNPSVVEALRKGKDPYWGIDFEKKPLATTPLGGSLRLFPVHTYSLARAGHKKCA